jgi:hypothetical protein
MEKVKRNGWKVAFLAAMALVCSHVIFGDVDNWEHNGPPAPTMTSLDKIYDAVNTGSCGVAEREGFCGHWHVGTGATQNVMTVPAGKNFVLLKLTASTSEWNIIKTQWDLTLNDQPWISGQFSYFSTSEGRHTWDFPDRCVVAHEGDVVKFVNTTGYMMYPTVIGYFYDVP